MAQARDRPPLGGSAMTEAQESGIATQSGGTKEDSAGRARGAKRIQIAVVLSNRSDARTMCSGQPVVAAGVGDAAGSPGSL
jgi:hypothetical protein